MTIHWTRSIDQVDWEAMSELYRIAPLGSKSADWLRTAYSNSMFKCLAFEVLDTSVAGLEVGRRHTAAELGKILKPEAESCLRNADLDG